MYRGNTIRSTCTVLGRPVLPRRSCLLRDHRHKIGGEGIRFSWCKWRVRLYYVIKAVVQRYHLAERWTRRGAGRQTFVPVTQQRIEAPLQRPWIKRKTDHIVESAAVKTESNEVVGQPGCPCSLPLVRRS